MRYYSITVGLLFFLLPERYLLAQIYINHVVYQPAEPKVFFVSQPSDRFWIRDIKSSQVVFKSSLQFFKSRYPAISMDLFLGNFSQLSHIGTYRIEVLCVGESLSFRIGEDVYWEVFRRALKSYYYQRCNFDLLEDVASPFYHTKCHQFDAFSHASTGKSGYKNTAARWHDAGDFGKYVVSVVISVETPLMAYEYFPHFFQSDTVQIPENLNEIPDLSDEIRYELEWLLKMQDIDGGVYSKVTPQVLAPFVMPQKEQSKRFIYQKSSTATADFAAVMALASRVYRPYDASFADYWLIAGKRVWDFLNAHPEIVPDCGFHNPSGTITGEYGDSNDRDECFWAAIQLFLTINDTKFHDYFLQHFREKGVFQRPMYWGELTPLAKLAYLKSTNPALLSSVKNELQFGPMNYAQILHQRIHSNRFFISLNPGEYYWGSNFTVLNNAILLIFTFDLTIGKNYLNDAYSQFYYILDLNVLAKTFVIAIGSNYPRLPHHHASASNGIEEPISGFLVGGPNQCLQDDILKSLFDENTSPALCYIDDQRSYVSNEVAINWNEPLVFVTGYFAGNELLTQICTPSHPQPQKLQIFPNYSNPFNSGTRFSIFISKSQPIHVSIRDALGRSVLEKNLGYLPPGMFNFTWDARNDRGKQFHQECITWLFPAQHIRPREKY